LKLLLIISFFLAALNLSCSDDGASNAPLVVQNDIVEEVEEIDIVPWTPEPEILPECIECKMYFCPPLDSIWQKEICMNICDDPQTLYSQTECTQFMECDPTQYLIKELDCTTEDGYPGTQNQVCNKGKIEYTDCVTDCEEESCNYKDDDCDGEIDEGQLNDCNECGLIPAEDCNGYDDDCDGIIDEALFQPCSTACGAGYEMCYDGNWISCTAPPALEEICDGLDNDCDGAIDEDLDCICTIQDVGTLFPCQDSPLICGQGYKTCECVDPDCKILTMTECYALCNWLPPIDPAEICDPLIGMPLNKEECNNFDDNCNQLIDEDIYAACYTGPDGTLMVGICIPGEVTCNAGEWGSYDENEDFVPYYCKDEITPQEEVCNGLDDDCDGIADWGEEMKETDVLFIVDWSGSMGDEMDAVMIALNQFAKDFSDEQVIKWAFVRGPVSHNEDDERLELLQNLTGFSNFLAALASMGDGTAWNGNTTAFEMLIDAVYIAVHNITATLPKPMSDFIWIGQNPGTGPSVVESSPPLQNFDIDWRPGADRVIIVFSDETPQSYLVPQLTIENAKMAVSGVPQLKLYTFSRVSGVVQWEDLAIAGNGKWFKLTNNPTEMYASLMEIIDEICKVGNNEDN
tara:strand:+ start:3570 stop:5462 length:1893 start_codon:yes stop_codon:yes gene_type:complete